MPLLPELDFAAGALAVSYRASTEPQDLAITVRLKHAEPGCVGPRRMGTLLDTIGEGAAGGSDFHPAVSSADLVSGTVARELAGPDLSWLLRVSGISPVFIRSIVEQLRICGAADNPVVAMSIFGSLPLDGTPLSVREGQVRQWLEDPGAYPGEWPEPGFPVSERDAMGASLRIQLGADLGAESEDELQGLCYQWVAATFDYVDQHGDYQPFDAPNVSRRMPKFGVTRRELRAYFEEFTRARIPSRAMLVNMLCRYHHTVLPIVAVEIAL